MVEIQVHEGKEDSENFFYNPDRKEFSLIDIYDDTVNEKFSINDLEIFEEANDDNVKKLDSYWILSEAKSEVQKLSTVGAAFGILGIVGETMFKGYKLTFIAKFRNGKKILATMYSNLFEEIKKQV